MVKGTVNLIPSDPPSNGDNAPFTTVPLIDNIVAFPSVSFFIAFSTNKKCVKCK